MDAEDFTVRSIRNLFCNGSLPMSSFYDELINRAKKIDEDFCLFDSLEKEIVEKQVKILLEERKKGEVEGALFGVPFLVSNDFETSDLFEKKSSDYLYSRTSKNTTLIRRMLNEGAVLLGKTKNSNFKNFFLTSTIKNPHNHNFSAGLTVASSAVSVSTGIVPISIASQTNTTLITNAAYCGVYGYTPSHKLFPLTGLKTISPSFDNVGFFSRDIDGLALVAEIVNGDDGIDIYSERVKKKKFTSLIYKKNNLYIPQVLLVKNSDFDDLSKKALKIYEGIVKELNGVITEIELPKEIESIDEEFERIYFSELSFNASSDFKSQEKFLSKNFCERITRGESVTVYEYLKAKKKIEKGRKFFEEIFDQFDSIISFGEYGKLKKKSKVYKNTILSKISNFYGLPSLSIPIFDKKEKLPLNIQFIGEDFGDAKLLRTAKLLMESKGEIDE